MVRFTGHTITSDSALGGKIIEKSLRFNRTGSHRLNFTASSAGNRKTWTKSFWMKRTSEDRRMIHGYYNGSNDVAVIEINEYGDMHIYDYYNSYRMRLNPNRKFRDCTSWMHIVVNIDTPQSTASERAKLYVNGERVTSWQNITYPSQNLDVSFNQNVLEAWGTEGTNQRLHFDGYLADVYYIDGAQLEPTQFGYTDQLTGIWKPKHFDKSIIPNRRGRTYDGTFTASGNGFGSNPPALAFNGGGSDGFNNAAGGQIITWDTSSYGLSGNVRIYGRGSAYDVYINGNATKVADMPSSNDWVDLGTHEKINEIQWAGTTYNTNNGLGSAGVHVNIIQVNGVYLRNDLSEFGQNGYHLEFKDDSGTTATTMGKDTSGNGNNWTPVNFSVASDFMTDIVTDSPTNNFCVLNYNGGSGNKVRDGGLSAQDAGTNGWRHTYGTFPLTRGKWYWEYRFSGSVNGSNGIFMGLYHPDLTYERDPNSSSTDMYGRQTDTRYSNGTNTSSHFPSFSDGNTVQFAFDADTGVMWSGVNNTWTGAEPSTGNSPSYTGIDASKGYVPVSGSYGSNNYNKVNFGQQGFKYTPPSGFKAICSEFMEMPEATVFNPKKHFRDLYYTGNAGTQSITGLEFKPDFVWVKRRDGGQHHAIYDSVRGNLKSLSSSRNDLTEYNETAALSEFLENGIKFTGSGFYYVNTNGDDYVAWCWKAGSPIVDTSASVFFQPTYDVLQLASTTDFDFSTGDFTLELYYRAERYNQTPYLFEFRASGGNEAGSIVCYVQSSGEAVFWYNGSNRVISNSVITLSKWTHIAFVRHSGTTKMYIDGVAQSQTYTDTNDYGDGGRPLFIGVRRNGGSSLNNQSWDGELSNVRIVKGTAVYTSNFTPSTTPLTNISNTKLLCCQSTTSATTAAVTPGTITANGGVTPSISNPFDAFMKDGIGYPTASAAGITEGSNPITGASINTKSGFSCFTYMGNGTSGATIGHGLGAAPVMAIFKSRNLGTLGTAGAHWTVSHKGLTNGMNGGGSARKIHLSLTQAEGTNSHGCVTATTSTTMTLTSGSGNDTDAHVNHTGGNYVCYCWTEIPGFSKFGRYKGNGNTNGPYIDCGFRPAFVMMKEITDASTNWVIYDNKRGANTYNPVDLSLYPNLNNQEGDATLDYDFVSNGFKVRTSNGGINGNGNNYIFMAFAEQPEVTPFGSQSNAR